MSKNWSYFFGKCDQIPSFLQIWSHLLRKSLTENFSFCTVQRVKSFCFMDDRSHVLILLIVENDFSAVALIAPITNNSLITRFFHKQHFYRQRQAEIGKKLGKVIIWPWNPTILDRAHCVKSVQIRSYFWSVFSCIQFEYKKIRTRKCSVSGHFSRCDFSGWSFCETFSHSCCMLQ